jgi:hypothetical protein
MCARVTFALLLVLGSGCGTTPDMPPALVPTERPVERPAVPALVGTASCASRGCHGGSPAATPLSAGSFTTWFALDPHARSYETLQSGAARAMATRLGIGAPARSVTCLACHVNPLSASEVARAPAGDAVFGVGCESCHGPAGAWLEPHASRVWWDAWERSARGPAGGGFRWLPDPVARAEVCAGCHVGAPPTAEAPRRDVNHDLIAAGHPPLRFEFTAYLAHLPRHWSERPGRNPAREWAVGQAVTSAASYELLAARAADPRSPWPELAEYACYSCHRSLAGAAPRGGGRLRFGTWYHPLAGVAAEFAPPGNPAGAMVAEVMNRRPYDRDIPDAASAAATAARASARRLAAAPFGSAERQALARRLAQGPLDEWDNFSRAVSGLAAVTDPVADPVRAKALRALFRHTLFPVGGSGPERLGEPAGRGALLREFH